VRARIRVRVREMKHPQHMGSTQAAHTQHTRSRTAPHSIVRGGRSASRRRGRESSRGGRACEIWSGTGSTGLRSRHGERPLCHVRRQRRRNLLITNHLQQHQRMKRSLQLPERGGGAAGVRCRGRGPLGPFRDIGGHRILQPCKMLGVQFLEGHAQLPVLLPEPRDARRLLNTHGAVREQRTEASAVLANVCLESILLCALHRTTCRRIGVSPCRLAVRRLQLGAQGATLR